MERSIRGVRLQLVHGDITDQDVDAIVNAANSALLGGGGVDGAIHRRGGPEILEECKKIRSKEWPNGLPPGKTVVTSGGKLKARYVIHTVGPIWRGGKSGEPRLLADAYRNCLELAAKKGLESIAFPSISTGAYEYPIEEAARIAIKTVSEFLEQKEVIENVRFILFTHSDMLAYESATVEILG